MGEADAFALINPFMIPIHSFCQLPKTRSVAALVSVLALQGIVLPAVQAAQGPNPPAAITDANWIAIDGRYATNAFDEFYVRSLVVDAQGKLYVSHASWDSSFDDPVACLIYDGLQWTRRPWDPSNYDPIQQVIEPLALTVDGRGSLFVGGYSFGVDTSFGALGVWAGDQPLFTDYFPSRNQKITSLSSDGLNHVYLGGSGPSLTLVDGTKSFTVAQWDGEKFSALGDGLPDGVNALAAGRDGVVYAGSAVNGIVSRWDGQQWTALGSQFSGVTDVSINALVLDHQGNLYAGGNFSRVGDQVVRGIARWDGSSWSALGQGVSGSVFALTVDAGDTLYVGGDFKHAGATPANGIARWDGQAWSALGSGVSGGTSPGVLTLGFDPMGNLYAGGDFTRAGTNSVKLSIAKLLLHGPLPGQIGITRMLDGTESLTFLGIPGGTYALDLATNLVAPIQWLARATNSAATNSAASAGYVAFTNGVRLRNAYFRVRSVP